MPGFDRPVFLLGAGFNLDANRLIPESEKYFEPGGEKGLTHEPCLAWELLPLKLEYPMVKQLVASCFGPDADLAKGAEVLFSEAYERADWVVFRRLTTILQGADRQVASRIIERSDTPYSCFFRDCGSANFISFNYDCLAELYLRNLGLWHPSKGFGIEAEAYSFKFPNRLDRVDESSQSTVVLHLHGSLYLYPRESDMSPQDQSCVRWLTMRDIPSFVFDPDSLSHVFDPYSRPHIDHNYTLPEMRFIPPISDKTDSLKETYTKVLFKRAGELIKEAGTMIAIGYSFAESDSPAFRPLLKHLFSEGKKLIVISPSARACTQYLETEYRALAPCIESIPMTFAQWVASGYVGLRE